MQLKTTVGLASRFMPISDALFRQRKCKGCKNGVSCNAAIFADSNFRPVRRGGSLGSYEPPSSSYLWQTKIRT